MTHLVAALLLLVSALVLADQQASCAARKPGGAARLATVRTWTLDAKVIGVAKEAAGGGAAYVDFSQTELTVSTTKAPMSDSMKLAEGDACLTPEHLVIAVEEEWPAGTPRKFSVMAHPGGSSLQPAPVSLVLDANRDAAFLLAGEVSLWQWRPRIMAHRVLAEAEGTTIGLACIDATTFHAYLQGVGTVNVTCYKDDTYTTSRTTPIKHDPTTNPTLKTLVKVTLSEGDCNIETVESVSALPGDRLFADSQDSPAGRQADRFFKRTRALLIAAGWKENHDYRKPPVR